MVFPVGDSEEDMAGFDAAPTPYLGSERLAAERVTAFLRLVYGWMFAGLAVTALVAYLVAGSPAIVDGDCDQPCSVLDPGHRAARRGRAALGARAVRSRRARLPLLFLGYSALTGITMAFVLLIYTGESVATTFLITAGMFGATAALRHDDPAQSGRRRPVPVHGAHRHGDCVDRRASSGTTTACSS